MSTDDTMIHDYYLSEVKVKFKSEQKNSKDNKESKIALEEKRLGNKKREIIDNKLNSKIEELISEEDFKKMPKYSMYLEIEFMLKRSYTSKGEGEFNVIDNKIFENPIVRDKLTGLPMVRSSTWKGHLRFAAERVNNLDGKDINEITKTEIIERLFGSETTSEDAIKGRLHFFPTCFDKDAAKKDVITPLSRTTRTPVSGKSPITLEVVKEGAKGKFRLLYFPYPRDKMFSKEQVKTDLMFLTKALELMFFTFGFSAKKTSGFGVIKPDPTVVVSLRPDKQQTFNEWNEFKNYINNLWSGDHE